MKENIGLAAGDIWKALKGHGEVNAAQLSKMLNMKSALVYQALGWLAREDKINYRVKGEKIFVSLNDAEN